MKGVLEKRNIWTNHSKILSKIPHKKSIFPLQTQKNTTILYLTKKFSSKVIKF